MALALNIQLTQGCDATQLYLEDITGVYSTGNLTGWGSPNINTSLVTGVSISGTIRTYPASSPVQNIPSTELMPSPNSLPYVVGQEFTLTPTLLGLGSANFPDGIYTLLYTISYSCTYTITDGDANFTVFTVGQTITDTSTGKVIGTVASSAIGTLVLNNVTGNTVSIGDIITNGTSNITLSNLLTTAFGTCTGNFTIQKEITCNIDACLGVRLSQLVLNNNCECKNIKNVFENIFEPLIISKAQTGCTQNNSALNSLAVAENNCLGNDCGC